MPSVAMIGFSKELAKYFTDLNLAWLEKYFVVEPLDHEMLSNPKAYIIDKGGYIFFAMVDGKVAGTFALIKISEQVYELSKMAVEAEFQGRNIGNTLIKFCIEEARKLGIHTLMLYSNTKLEPAIHLYKKYGFKEVLLDDTEYIRANIKMEKHL